jgi:hypothetical protein
MRRTKVTQIYKKTGNLRAVQLLLGHTKMDSTVRYLDVELEDALAIAEAIEIIGIGLSSRTALRRHSPALAARQCSFRIPAVRASRSIINDRMTAVQDQAAAPVFGADYRSQSKVARHKI